ncbi:hypothetical protein L6164_003052 [Bauhinia variegata]|uniref:Uncharacterized protein n=1 Tax=Bauhinia variegata TaxID=167791 RepID=A0ACB9Q1L1_BAUVA|nr:hypothetical protein L6164_003052 [Bauhinia variegata]
MASVSLLLQRRSLCIKASKKWRVKQVSKSNFAESLEEIKARIDESDFIAVSMEKTGSFSAPWHRVLPLDTAETAYCKAKHAAERFQLLQFAVCPFSLRDSDKLIADPYNFLLFPRDELRMGMPSYSFSCQTSYLTSMASEGFDFNACIYDGLSYISRAQESSVGINFENPLPSPNVIKSSTTSSVADTVFVERVRSRIKYWKNTCKGTGTSTGNDEALLNSLRKIVLQNEVYRSRPCLTIDVCSERQVQLILEMLVAFSDDLVPMLVPSKGGTAQVIRVVLTSSKEDKDLFERELQNFQEEQNKKVCGFREVIDLISASQKPVLSHNSLNDFTFIHSKFIAPLPFEVDEFISSLHMVFPHILDVNHLMKDIGPLRKMTSIPAALSYLKNHLFAPIDMEFPDQDTVNEGKIHGLNALRICYLFMKLCSVLKISPIVVESGHKHLPPELHRFTNAFHQRSTSIDEKEEGNISVWKKNTRKVSCDHLVFLWGFKSGMTAGALKSLLCGSHDIFSGEFDVKLLDKSCAIVVFWQPGLSKAFQDVMDGEEISGPLQELASDGLRVTSYETYERICRLGLWEMDLAESLDRALDRFESDSESNSERKFSEIHWYNDNVINLDDL